MSQTLSAMWFETLRKWASALLCDGRTALRVSVRCAPGLVGYLVFERRAVVFLAAAGDDLVLVRLDAAGFERIIVETVGVGQAEVEIAHLAHTTLVVEAPGLGDGVQAIKAGVLEIADVLVVNKADLPGVDRTVQALEAMLEMRNPITRPLRHHGQLIDVVAPAPPTANTAPWPVIVMRTE